MAARLGRQLWAGPARPAGLMRHLSQHYPRKEMSWVYATVKTLYGSSS